MPETKEYQRPSARELLAKSGFENINVFPSEKPDILLFSAEKDGRSVFIKAADTVKNGVDRIENQALADELLHREVTNTLLHVPDGKSEKSQGYTFAVMDKAEGVVIADSKPDGLKEKISDDDLDALVEWLVAVRCIPSERIPDHFKNIARDVWNKQFYAERLQQNAQEPLALGLLTENEFEALKAIWDRHFGLLTFQHHDLVPFNIMRGKNDKLWLIDGEFARLGMAGYDPAYFALQTYALYGEAKLAATMLDKTLAAWSKDFPEDKLETSILAPLAYRIVASLNDAPTKNNQQVRDRTMHLKNLILQKNVQSMITELRSHS